jgi:hypothetical protein
MLPREFLGRARALRQRVAVADAGISDAITIALEPLRRRLAWHPVQRADKLVDAARSWRLGVPDLGRVMLLHDLDDRRSPVFREMRVTASGYRNTGWEGDDYERGVSVTVISASVRDRRIIVQTADAVFVPLHAIARRFQRAHATTDADVLDDITTLAVHRARILDADNFTIELRGGSWRGRSVMVGRRRLPIVRTFIDHGLADDRARVAA